MIDQQGFCCFPPTASSQWFTQSQQESPLVVTVEARLRVLWGTRGSSSVLSTRKSAVSISLTSADGKKEPLSWHSWAYGLDLPVMIIGWESDLKWEGLNFSSVWFSWISHQSGVHSASDWVVRLLKWINRDVPCSKGQGTEQKEPTISDLDPRMIGSLSFLLYRWIFRSLVNGENSIWFFSTTQFLCFFLPVRLEVGLNYRSNDGKKKKINLYLHCSDLLPLLHSNITCRPCCPFLCFLLHWRCSCIWDSWQPWDGRGKSWLYKEPPLFQFAHNIVKTHFRHF